MFFKLLKNDSDDDLFALAEPYYFCDVCDGEGSLFLCGKCQRAFHLGCLLMNETPQTDWICRYCDPKAMVDVSYGSFFYRSAKKGVGRIPARHFNGKEDSVRTGQHTNLSRFFAQRTHFGKFWSGS